MQNFQILLELEIKPPDVYAVENAMNLEQTYNDNKIFQRIIFAKFWVLALSKKLPQVKNNNFFLPGY